MKFKNLVKSSESETETAKSDTDNLEINRFLQHALAKAYSSKVLKNGYEEYFKKIPGTSYKSYSNGYLYNGANYIRLSVNWDVITFELNTKKVKITIIGSLLHNFGDWLDKLPGCECNYCKWGDITFPQIGG